MADRPVVETKDATAPLDDPPAPAETSAVVDGDSEGVGVVVGADPLPPLHDPLPPPVPDTPVLSSRGLNALARNTTFASRRDQARKAR